MPFLLPTKPFLSCDLVTSVNVLVEVVECGRSFTLRFVLFLHRRADTIEVRPCSYAWYQLQTGIHVGMFSLSVKIKIAKILQPPDQITNIALVSSVELIFSL